MSVMGDARSKRYMIHENRLKYDVDEILFRTDGRKLFSSIHVGPTAELYAKSPDSSN